MLNVLFYLLITEKFGSSILYTCFDSMRIYKVAIIPLTSMVLLIFKYVLEDTLQIFSQPVASLTSLWKWLSTPWMVAGKDDLLLWQLLVTLTADQAPSSVAASWTLIFSTNGN